MKNLLTDISGVRVGHADDKALASGVTAVIFDTPAVAAIDIRGGGPGIREGAVLDLENTVEQIHGIALAGGSAFGLEAGGGVQAWLAEQGRGFAVGGALIPIVPGAICFDLLNGGDKAWGRFAPYRDLGYAAAASAAVDFALGSVGAGLGATTADIDRRHRRRIENDSGDPGCQCLVIGVTDADAGNIGEEILHAFSDPAPA